MSLRLVVLVIVVRRMALDLPVGMLLVVIKLTKTIPRMIEFHDAGKLGRLTNDEVGITKTNNSNMQIEVQ
jgi:hypothetical protein